MPLRLPCWLALGGPLDPRSARQGDSLSLAACVAVIDPLRLKLAQILAAAPLGALLSIRSELSTSASCEGWPANRSCERSERSAKVGGEYRARTGDLLVANQALSQLS